MKKFLKRFALIFSILLVVLLILTVITAALFEKKIGRKILAETNKNLATELIVESFDLSLLRAFPNVSADLRDVQLKDMRGGTLLQADNLSFRFGLFSLLSSSIKVKSIVVSNGALSVFIDEGGRGNYDIMKQSEASVDSTSESSGGVNISLATARLKNIDLTFVDAQALHTVSALVENAAFSGEFSSSEFSLTSTAQLFSRFVENEGRRFLVNKNLGYDARINVNLNDHIYQLSEVTLDVESNIFRAEGAVEIWKEGPYFDLYLHSEESSLGAVLKLLPAEYLQQFGDFNSTGSFLVSASIKGLSNTEQNPRIDAELEMKDGQITNPRMEGSLKDVSFKAQFNNGRFRTKESSSFQLSDFKAYFNRELVEMDLLVDNFDHPEIDFQLDGVVPMASVYGLLNNPKVTNGSGEIEIKNLRISGRYEDMIRPARVGEVASTGEIEFDDASLTINGEEMILDRGQLRLEGNRLSLDQLKLEGAGSTMTFSGTAFNLIPVLFADSLNSQRAELEFQAELTAEKMDIDRLMKLSALAQTGTQVEEQTLDSLRTDQIQKREQMTDKLNGAFTATIRAFNYREIQGENFEGKLDLDNNELAILGSTRTMGGAFELDGRVFFEEKPRLSARLSGGGIDIQEFFRQNENFYQDVLTYENLQGALHTKMAIYAYWDEKGNFLMDDLRVLAAVGIEEGELKDFGILENFSSFVNIKDLENIKFTNLENFLEIRKRRLYIPVMFIRSNAANLTVNGEHTFDNEMRYNLKVNAGQVLANRFKSHDPSLRPVKARKKGFFNLYYTIEGTIDDYEFKANKREIKDEFELSDIRRQEIQTALEKEFGIIELVREPEDWRDIPEFDYGKDQGEDEYLEWEEEGGKKGSAKSGG